MGKSLEGRPVPAQQFAKNMRLLLSSRGWTQTKAAREIGVKLKWLQRACHAGLAEHVKTGKKSNDAQLKAVVRAFKLGRISALWDVGLVIRPPEKHDAHQWYQFEEATALIRQLLIEQPRCRQVQRIFDSINRHLGSVEFDRDTAARRKRKPKTKTQTKAKPKKENDYIEPETPKKPSNVDHSIADGLLSETIGIIVLGWVEHEDGISFDKDGRLQNAQRALKVLVTKAWEKHRPNYPEDLAKIVLRDYAAEVRALARDAKEIPDVEVGTPERSHSERRDKKGKTISTL